ncbi:MAG TPA: PhnD/SsuA/transferrin family substrate-binding protein [Geobacteraceae bacterium]|nr:PhnD/SsuA/transferrin family substrate-binding protein [Geobacteraceae bacterium]
MAYPDAKTCASSLGRRILALLLMALCIICRDTKAEEPAKFHVRVGFSSRAFIHVPTEDIKVAIRMLAQKVASKTTGSADSIIYESTRDIERDIKTRKVDVLALMPDEFIYLSNRVPLEPVVVTAFDKDYEVEILLLARKESGFATFSDLRGREIVMPAKVCQYGNTYYTWIETLVMKEGYPEAGLFFSSIRTARTPSQILLPVFFRKADACVLTRNAYDVACELNPQIGRELKVIARINRLAGGVIAIHRDLPEERKQKVKQALLTLHEDPEGKQMFVIFQLHRLVPYRPEYLKATEALLAEHRELRQRIVNRH